MLMTTDPRTGSKNETEIGQTSTDQVAAIAEAAAATDLGGRSREFRAELLDTIALAIESRRADLVSVADSETGLGSVRLNGEVSRSAFQFSMFAAVVRDGGYLEAMIDHGGETPLGAAPDVRRMLVPLGPVAVFGSSNFPFAFSVLGGDTASALAAGCPVVAKAHGSHVLTSKLSFEVLQAALAELGASPDCVGIVYGQAAGTALVQHPAITAVGFTGSLGAAEALRAAIGTRDTPIPFFGELSSINPLIITEGAAAARGPAIAEGLFTSFTGSAGQLCTKPGIAFIPVGDDGDALVADLVGRTEGSTAQVLLNDRIKTSFGEISERLEHAGAQQIAVAPAADGAGFTVPPTLLQTTATGLSAELAEECFGPLIVLARYHSLDEVAGAFALIPRSLTATVHAEADETDAVTTLLPTLQATAGRIVFNGFPTGVRVSWAQHHGGPWPATNTQHTSVGATAIDRFLRPVAWQNAPAAALPTELRDDYTAIPRRVDGELRLAGR